MHQGLTSFSVNLTEGFFRVPFSCEGVRMALPLSGSNCLSFFFASTRVSGWQLVTKAVTALAIFL